MSQARCDKKSLQITIELRHPAISFIRHVELLRIPAVIGFYEKSKWLLRLLFGPQRGPYANETQKQTLLQGKCVTYNKNKLNNKRNR